jgi:chemotaxis response regulator CheB
MRVGIVNDVQMAVEVLRRVVTSAPEHTVAWVAYDGAEAAERCLADTPDVVLMDLIMPVVNGVEATRRMMRQSPCAILVVTANVDHNASLVFDAMGQGALDAVNTPVLQRGGVEGGAELLAKLATIGRLLQKSTGRSAVEPRPTSAGRAGAAFLAIGASTGGPAALAAVLSALPRGGGFATAIVQHVDAQFAPGLRRWLERESGHPVLIAEPGARPEAGGVVLAATNDHLVLRADGTFGYVIEPADYPYRPSVDVFFSSVVAHWRGTAVGVLLTGMGRDGAEGLLAMRRAGWVTIAQDKDSSVVYGMPKAAAEIGAASQVLPLGLIAPAVAAAVGLHPSPRKDTA